ncbi:hypothetical protein [Vibrio sp. J383]|uniref:hypothetical protein n=1 Tax=Vibrio sp. J383 TaxID=2942997 RepID=UPI0020BD7C63|nr:hypothetical protein [Vibrio sp. J383]UQV24839.1 hypothetical protein M4S28_26220 [Vibrio sp. J383]
MPFKKIKHHRNTLVKELNAISNEFQLHSLLIMESTHETMVVFAANEQPVYNINDAGPKSTNAGCHELYCERVVNTQKALLVSDAGSNEEWSGNEDLVKFGLGWVFILAFH